MTQFVVREVWVVETEWEETHEGWMQSINYIGNKEPALRIYEAIKRRVGERMRGGWKETRTGEISRSRQSSSSFYFAVIVRPVELGVGTIESEPVKYMLEVQPWEPR